MAGSFTSFLNSLDGNISNVAEAGRTELASTADKIRGYCTFRAEEVRGALERRKGKGKLHGMNSQSGGEGLLGRARRVLGGLLCVGATAAQQEEADEESWLLREGYRGRHHQSSVLPDTEESCQPREEPEQKPETAGGSGHGVVGAGGRAGGALRQGGRWLLEGLKSYAELGFPSLSPSLGLHDVDDPRNWALMWP